MYQKFRLEIFTACCLKVELLKLYLLQPAFTRLAFIRRFSNDLGNIYKQ